MKKIALPKLKKEKNNYLSLNFIEEAERAIDYHIEFFGNKTVSIEGCKGISEYTEDYVKVNIKHGYFTIFGNGLVLNYMSDTNITVSGKITNVEFTV